MFEKAKEKKNEEEETFLRKELIGAVLDNTWLTEDDVKIMRKMSATPLR